jgi:integrase
VAGRRRPAARPDGRLQPPRVTDKLVPVFTAEELARLEQACAGRSFGQRRDTAIIAVFKATGIRLSELAGLRYHPGDPRRSDIDLWQREITVRGKGGKDRIVKIGHQAARSLDRYLRARSRHHFSHTWLDRGGPEGDLMELNGWTSPHHDRHLTRRQRPSQHWPWAAPRRLAGGSPSPSGDQVRTRARAVNCWPTTRA